MKNLTRRDFLKLVSKGLLGLSGLFGLGGLIRFISYEPAPPPPREYRVGLADSYPQGSRTLLTQIPALLIHNPDGFSAISLTCPHLGCTVETTESGFGCPCHGSRFGSDGQLLEGPASQELKKLSVEIIDGEVIVLKA